ncbi:MAG: alpha/beta fold hydrolase [Clostridiales bacterium]|nr:alpha/beta fold hydrolase [Clostridiales bacterium]
MKRILICCAMALNVLLSACTPTSPAVEDMPADVLPTVETAARQTVADLASGDYAAVTARFDKTMAESLPADKLKEAWETTAGEAGSYAEIVSAESFMQEGYYICLVTTRHEIKGIVSRVVYGKDMQIAGLFFSYTENKSELTETETTVTIGAEYPLYGVLALPGGTNKVPAVVLVHGSGPNDKDQSVYGIKVFKDISDYLAANGVAVLRYDKRTYTHAAKLSSDITVEGETIEDAILAGKLLTQNGRIDSTKIYVIGHSLGGMLAPRIVDESSGVFAGAVIMAGSPRSLLDIIYDQNMYFISLADESERDALTKQVEDAKPYYGLPQGYIDEMDAHPASDYLTATDKPYMILQGGRDFQVSPEKDFEAYKQFAGGKSNFEFRLYDNLNHLFTVSTMGSPTTDDYIAGTHVDNAPLEDIAEWIKAR